MVEYFAVLADSFRFQAVVALCTAHWDWEHLFQVHQGSVTATVITSAGRDAVFTVNPYGPNRFQMCPVLQYSVAIWDVRHDVRSFLAKF